MTTWSTYTLADLEAGDLTQAYRNAIRLRQAVGTLSLSARRVMEAIAPVGIAAGTYRSMLLERLGAVDPAREEVA